MCVRPWMYDRMFKKSSQGGSTMKKAVAVLVSVLLYIVAFLLMFRVSMGDRIRWFLFGFPVITAIYFVIAGNLFARRLHLNRWFLWLSMNFAGGLCSLVLLLVWFPTLLFNGIILVLIGPLIGVFAVVWAVVGLGFLCVKGLKGRAVPSERMERPNTSHSRQADVRGGMAKKVIFVGGILLLCLAAGSLYVGVRGFASIRPAAAYVDSGVHTFTPYDILPVQVKNNATGRVQRNNPTRTVYMVYYQTTDGTGYRWRAEGGSVRDLAEQVYDRGPVERRVLSIPADNTYITVKPEQTAEGYTSSLRRKYVLILGLSGGYVLVYAAAWVVILRRSQRRKAMPL